MSDRAGAVGGADEHYRVRAGPAVFALGSSRALGEAIARALRIELAPHEERDFEDGEHKARPLSSVRGRDAVVVSSLYGDDRLSVNDKLCRLLFFIGALGDAAAERVTAVTPYLCYARKERQTKPRDPVTTRYVAEMFEAVGTDRIVAVDIHNLPAYQNAFRIDTEHLEAGPLFAAHFARVLGPGAAVVVSPDAGGVKRAERFRGILGRALAQELPLAFIEKFRSAGVVRGEAVVGEVAGRQAILLDDLVSTGTTLARAAAACRAAGATSVRAAATHGLFVGRAADVVTGEALDELVVTNSVPPFRLPPAAAARVTVLDIAPLLAEAIRRIHGGGSLTELAGA